MNVYFRNPDIKFRPEEWGGVVLVGLEVYPLDREHYQALVDFIEFDADGLDGTILESLLEIGAVCCISKEEALAITSE